MSSIADRNRELLIQRIESDPRLNGEKVIAASALMRVSIIVTVFAGILGAVAAQAAFGPGGLQFIIGLALGYLAYFAYLAATMREPRVIGAMAALTPTRLVLLGSRKAGLVGDYPLQDLERLEMTRKGNLFVMGKLAMTTPEGDITFWTTNRRMAQDFVARFEEMRQRGSR
ncbi:MAG: hypothetical protein QNJ89_07760 [Acidimicrobiia bacterium]|nr:hypothetical protein [Acidimicrobiia bacterium]